MELKAVTQKTKGRLQLEMKEKKLRLWLLRLNRIRNMDQDKGVRSSRCIFNIHLGSCHSLWHERWFKDLQIQHLGDSRHSLLMRTKLLKFKIRTLTRKIPSAITLMAPLGLISLNQANLKMPKSLGSRKVTFTDDRKCAHPVGNVCSLMFTMIHNHYLTFVEIF